MFFTKKGFFLELEDGSKPASPAVSVALAEEAPGNQPDAPAEAQAVGLSVAAAPEAAAAVAEPQGQSPAPTPEATQASTAPKAPSLTTAEAIAAELAAAEAARPEVTLTTFAVDALQPGNALRPQKRRPGANLKGFRSMAADLFKSSSTGRETSL
ncbi:MAG: hypothetical protein ACON4T_09400 [Synechococcus sp.]